MPGHEFAIIDPGAKYQDVLAEARPTGRPAQQRGRELQEIAAKESQ